MTCHPAIANKSVEERERLWQANGAVPELRAAFGLGPLRDAPAKSSKYGATPTMGPNPMGETERRYASKREAARAVQLEALRKSKHVTLWLPQVPMPMPPKPGEKRGAYVVDFLVFWADGRTTWEDAKGMRTDEYKRKKRWVEENYHIEVTEV